VVECVFQESHKHIDDADIEVEIQRELEEEEEAMKTAFKFNIEQELTKVNRYFMASLFNAT
jgi:hypothetical protein